MSVIKPESDELREDSARLILHDGTMLVGSFSSLLSLNSPDRFAVFQVFFLFPPIPPLFPVFFLSVLRTRRFTKWHSIRTKLWPYVTDCSFWNNTNGSWIKSHKSGPTSTFAGCNTPLAGCFIGCDAGGLMGEDWRPSVCVFRTLGYNPTFVRPHKHRKWNFTSVRDRDCVVLFPGWEFSLTTV